MVVQVKNKINSVDDLSQKALEIADRYKDCMEISLCSGTGCKAYLPQELYRLIKEELNNNKTKVIELNKNTEDANDWINIDDI